MPMGLKLGVGISSATPQPVASGNFTNIATNNAADGVYTIDGEMVAIGDIIDLDHGENNFDSILDIDAGGIKTRQSGANYISRQFAINDPLLTDLLTSGFTVLCEIYGEGSTVLGLSVHDNEFTFDAGGGTRNEPEVPEISPEVLRTFVSDKNFNQTNDDTQYPVLSQVNKFALTVASDRVSASVNGAPIVTVAGSGLDAAMANIVFTLSGDGTVRLRSFAFYDLVDDAALPTLSSA